MRRGRGACGAFRAALRGPGGISRLCRHFEYHEAPLLHFSTAHRTAHTLSHDEGRASHYNAFSHCHIISVPRKCARTAYVFTFFTCLLAKASPFHWPAEADEWFHFSLFATYYRYYISHVSFCTCANHDIGRRAAPLLITYSMILIIS